MKERKILKVSLAILLTMVMTLPVLASLPNVSATTTTYTVHYQYTVNGVTSNCVGAFVGLNRASSLNGDYSRVDTSHVDSSGYVSFDVTSGYYYTTIKASDDDQIEVCDTDNNNNDYKWDESAGTLISTTASGPPARPWMG